MSMLPTDEATIAPKAAASSSPVQNTSAPNVVEGQISFGGEVIRKMIHFGSLSIPIGYFYVTKTTALQVLVPVMIFSLVVDLARHSVGPVKRVVDVLFKNILRPHERESGLLSGATYVFILSLIHI